MASLNSINSEDKIFNLDRDKVLFVSICLLGGVCSKAINVGFELLVLKCQRIVLTEADKKIVQIEKTDQRLEVKTVAEIGSEIIKDGIKRGLIGIGVGVALTTFNVV